jgi:hypothetical protein
MLSPGWPLQHGHRRAVLDVLMKALPFPKGRSDF